MRRSTLTARCYSRQSDNHPGCARGRSGILVRQLVRTIAAAFLVAGLTLPLGAAGRTAAAEHYQRAQTLLEDLRAVPRPELGRQQYDLVIKAFEQVHRSSPSSGYCDEALLTVARLYAEKHDRFGEERYREAAIERYNFVIREYPHSKLLGEARTEMARLEKGANVTLSQTKPSAPAEPEPAPETAAAVKPTPKPAAAPTPTQKPTRPIPAPEVILTSTGSQRENRVATTPPRLHSGDAVIKDLRYWSTPEYTRIALELDDFAPFKFDFLSRPSRLYFDLLKTQLDSKLTRGGNFEIGDRAVERLRIAMNRANKARLVMDLNDDVFYDVSWLSNPPRLVIELRAKTVVRETLARQEEPTPAPPAAIESEEGTPEPVQAAEALPTPMPAVAGRIASEPKSFAEAFRALSSEGRAERAAQPAPAAFQPPASEPEPARPEAFVVREARTEAPQPRSAAAVDQAPLIPAGRGAEAPQEPIVLAKLEKPRTSPEPAARTEVLNIPPPKPADEPSKGSQSLIRALGLKVGKVVIDAGHGGHDTGSIGPTGLREKDVVLDVSMRLGKLIESRLGSEVLLTRDADKFLDLSVRNAVANKAQADLFISVHANSFTNRSVRGVETYYLNFTTDPWALKVASRENAASSKTVHQLQDLLSKIALKEKIDESREFAERMQGVLYGGLSTTTQGLRDRGVRQAPLMVLIGAKMPAILAEIGFLSNPTDEKLLKSSKYRQQVAELLYEGIESYVGSLSSHQLTMTDQERASASLD